MEMDIVIIEDEQLSADRLVKMLGESVPGAEVVSVLHSVKEGLEFFGRGPAADLVLADISLPDGLCFSIFDCCDVAIPVIFLTAKNAVADRVKGLRMGAEDYIVKPFEVLELLARVDVVLRRYNKTAAVIEIGGLTIDTQSMIVRRGEEEIALTRKEYELLLLFARNPNTALYRETIYERVWGGDFNYGSKTVDLHVQRLRRKVGWNERLQAVNKVGYRLEI